MDRLRRLLAALAGVPLAVALLAAAPPAAAPPAPRFGEIASVVAVEVPVAVSRDGQPVRGLKADNFEVYDGGVRQRLTGFEVIDLAAAGPAPATPSAAAPTPIAGRRHFLLLFDLLNSEPSSLVQARQAALRMVDTLPASDLVGVASYSRSHGARILLGFTSDRRQVQAAVAGLDAPQLYDRSVDPLGLLVADAENGEPANAGRTSSVATDLHDELRAVARDEFRESERLEQQSSRQQAVADVTALARSFAELARMLAAVPGRKYVVYLSEGFDSALLSGREAPIGAAANPNERGREYQEAWEVDAEQTFGSGKAQNEMQRLLAELRRTDCVIEAVDIGRLRAGGDERPRPGGTDTLVLLAKDTGGELYQNWNDLGAAMKQMLERTSVTYLLTFQPEDLRPDGAYHRLVVKLRDTPHGAVVAHRPGYYAPRPFARQAALERRLAMADLMLAGRDAGTLEAAVLAAPFRVAGPRAYVALFVEVDGEGLLRDDVEGNLGVELYAYAFDERGEVRGRLVQSVGLDRGRVGERLAEHGLKLYGHLDLEPGRYSLRVAVRNGRSGATAVRVLPLTITAAPLPALLPPLFAEPAGRWLMVREPAGSGPPVPYPFVVGERTFVPAARPQLVAESDVPLCLMGYELGDGPLVASAELEGADGRLVAARLTLGDRRRDAGGPDRLLGSLRAPVAPAGRYTLRVRLASGERELAVTTLPVDLFAPAAGAPR